MDSGLTSKTGIDDAVALKDIASIFSRQFAIGFYLPAFFALLALANVVDDKSLPYIYNHAASGTQVLIVGGFGLAVGLLLSGLHYPVLRLYEGYSLQHARERRKRLVGCGTRRESPGSSERPDVKAVYMDASGLE